MEKNNDYKNKLPVLKNNTLIYKGKFISYFIKNYEIKNKSNNNISIPYEAVDYNSRYFNQNEIKNEFIGKNKYNIYAVNIIPIIKYTSKAQKLIIVSVFRYPTNKFCLEFPAGFMDKSDTSGKDFSKALEIATLRELEEETGYKGKFISFTSEFFSKNNKNLENQLKLGSNIFFDPWKSSDNAIQCIVEINGDEITNNNKKSQKLDDSEIIQVFEVEINHLMKFINEKISKENYGCSSELYNFALGLSFNSVLTVIESKENE